MNKEQAVSYLRFSGFSDEQIKAIEGAFTCEDAISRQTGEDAIKRLRDILAEATETDNSVCYVTSDDADALNEAIEAIEQVRCLTGRPCIVCKYCAKVPYKDSVRWECIKWECVFKGV